MPATVTLSTTTLAESIDAFAKQIKVADASGILPGYRLWMDAELLSVVSLGIATSAYTQVNVLRGVDGSAAAPHSSAATITIGRADQFYSSNPVGAPPSAIPVSPYINVVNGSVWYAQGDSEGGGNRWWQQQQTTYSVGALGVRQAVQDPTSST